MTGEQVTADETRPIMAPIRCQYAIYAILQLTVSVPLVNTFSFWEAALDLTLPVSLPDCDHFETQSSLVRTHCIAQRRRSTDISTVQLFASWPR